MNLFETLKNFKNILPDPAFSEKSKRAILATLPQERWSFRRSLAHLLEGGVAVALVVFFVLIIAGQFSGAPSYIAPVQFSVINPQTLRAEAQAVDMQIQLADVAYEEPTSTSGGTTPAAVLQAINHAISAAASSSVSTSTAAAVAQGNSSTTPTSMVVISVDQALTVLSFGGVANATSTAFANVDTCPTVTPADFAALKTAETGPLDQELSLRKQLLTETIACAVQDTQTLQAALAAVTLPADGGAAVGVNAAAVQSQLAGNLNDALNFYGIESTKVGGAGVSATEAIANEMLAWRAANYAPLEGDVNNFALWASNQTLFETAQTRLTQTARIVSFIENAATTNGDLSASLAAAQTSFANAQNENAAAGAAIGQVQPSDATLALIQQSLQSLADAYQKFSDLNGFIQNVLPTAGN